MGRTTRFAAVESGGRALWRLLWRDPDRLCRPHKAFERDSYLARREALERRKEPVDQDWSALGLSDPDSEVFEE